MHRRTRRELVRDYALYVAIGIAFAAYAVLLAAIKIRTDRDVTPFIGVPIGIIWALFLFHDRFSKVRSVPRRVLYMGAAVIGQSAFCVAAMWHLPRYGAGRQFAAVLTIESIVLLFIIERLDNWIARKARHHRR